jgi:hypothetical protein
MLAPPPEPDAPDRASVEPLPEARERGMAALLDAQTEGVPCLAVPRSTALRAMSAAFDAGATWTVEPVEALAQLRGHQEQLDEHGARVGVSREALEEVLNCFVAPGAGK